MMRSGWAMSSLAFGQSRRCTDTPRPRVTNPKISSPGTGLQQRDRRTSTSSTPFTTMPWDEWVSCFFGRFTDVSMGAMMPVEEADVPTVGFSASSLPLSTRIFSRRFVTCWAFSLPVPMCTYISSGSLKPSASATSFSARIDWALDRPSPCLRISRTSMSRPICMSSERVIFEK